MWTGSANQTEEPSQSATRFSLESLSPLHAPLRPRARLTDLVPSFPLLLCLGVPPGQGQRDPCQDLRSELFLTSATQWQVLV